MEETKASKKLIHEGLEKYTRDAHFDEPSNLWLTKRFFNSALLFLGFFCTHTLDANISIAIVEMTSSKFITVGNKTVYQEAEFNWDSKTKGLVLGMNSYGVVCVIFVGYLVKRLGGTTSFAIGVFMPGVLTLLTPITLGISFNLFLMSRLLEGITEFFSYCSLLEIWAKWAPPSERSTLISFCFAGRYAAALFVFPFCGYVIENWGWPAVFYVTGGMGIVWSILWILLVSNNPSADRWISKKERLYLQKVIPKTSSKKIEYPWKQLATSKPLFALLVAKLSMACGLSIVVTCLPLYIKDSTEANTQIVALFSAIPHITPIFMIPIGGFVLDYLQNANILSTTQVHKLFVCSGSIIGAFLLFYAAFASNFTISIICLTLLKLTLTLLHLSLQLIPIYMAPNFPAMIASITSYGYSSGFIIGPTLVGYVVTNHTPAEWSICFGIIGLLLAFNSIIFVVFGSCSIQRWTDPNNDGSGMKENEDKQFEETAT